jgi:putative endonuclease
LLNKYQHLGKKGEQLANLFLQQKNYRIVIRNYRCKIGEIDIIAKDKNTLVFIEVKTRSDHSFGSPAMAVTARKQRQISRTAENYLAQNHLFDAPARFDVIGITLPADGKTEIDHIENAFDLYT